MGRNLDKGRRSTVTLPVGGKDTRVPKHLASLVICHGRARLMQTEFEAALARLDANTRTDSALHGTSDDLFKAWTFLYLWLACLQVVIEGYREAYKHGPPALSDEKI